MFSARHALLLDAAGAHVLCVGVKASFDLVADGPPILSPQQEEVMLAPRHIADDPARGLLREAELTLDHPGTDVIVNAVAHAPGARPVTTLTVTAQIGALHSSAQITGDRIWQRDGADVVPGPPQAFARMPLSHDRAFGGGHPIESGYACDERNPLGRGYCTDPRALLGQPLPNIETPGHDLSLARPGALVPLAGFAARSGQWLDRRRLAGTYDDTWRRQRLPLWPQDLHPGHFRPAMPALQSPTELLGHEEILLTNLSAAGPVRCRLPRVVPLVRSLIRGEKSFQPIHLRRIILEPELGRLIMFWRCMIGCGRDGRVVQRVTIDQRRIARAEVAA